MHRVNLLFTPFFALFMSACVVEDDPAAEFEVDHTAVSEAELEAAGLVLATKGERVVAVDAFARVGVELVEEDAVASRTLWPFDALYACSCPGAPPPTTTYVCEDTRTDAVTSCNRIYLACAGLRVTYIGEDC